jgi:hypothetical protein
MRIDQRSHEGRIKAPPLRHHPLEGNAAAAEPEGHDGANKVTLNRKTLTSKGTDGPVPWIRVAMTAMMNAAVPVRTANTARGYCETKKGAVPANISGTSVTSASARCNHV